MLCLVSTNQRGGEQECLPSFRGSQIVSTYQRHNLSTFWLFARPPDQSLQHRCFISPLQVSQVTRAGSGIADDITDSIIVRSVGAQCDQCVESLSPVWVSVLCAALNCSDQRIVFSSSENAGWTQAPTRSSASSSHWAGCSLQVSVIFNIDTSNWDHDINGPSALDYPPPSPSVVNWNFPSFWWILCLWSIVSVGKMESVPGSKYRPSNSNSTCICTLLWRIELNCCIGFFCFGQWQHIFHCQLNWIFNFFLTLSIKQVVSWR